MEFSKCATLDPGFGFRVSGFGCQGRGNRGRAAFANTPMSVCARRHTAGGVFANPTAWYDAGMKLEYLESGSSDCPLVRLYEFDASDLAHLCEHFQLLALGTVQRVALHELPFVEAVNHCRLVLRLSESDRGILRISCPGAFECVLTGEGWEDVNERAGALANTTAEAYQWLDKTGEISLLLSETGQW